MQQNGQSWFAKITYCVDTWRRVFVHRICHVHCATICSLKYDTFRNIRPLTKQAYVYL